MTRFLIRRIALGLIVILMVTILVFLLFFVGPGPQSVAHRLAGRQATPAQIEQVLKNLHLNQPLYDQYWRFLTQLTWHHNLGYSYYHGQPVTTVLKQAFPITLSLAVGASIIWLVLGVSTGVLSAVRRGSFWDRLCTILALIFYSMPVFVLGLLLLYVFYFQFTKHGIDYLPRPGLRVLLAESQRLVQEPGAPVDHPRPDISGDLHPPDARLHARGDG